MQMTRYATILALSLASNIPLAADGEPDPTFGTDGRTVLAFNQDLLGPTDVAIRVKANNDHAFVLGRVSRPASYASTITRLRQDGTPDDGFGDGGTVFLDTLDGFYDDYWLRDLVLDGQQRILVAGSARLGSNTNMLVCRLLASGDLDLTFGGNGSGCSTIAIDLVPNGLDAAESIVLQHNGRILVSGQASSGIDQSAMAVARLTSGGIKDDSFGIVDDSGYSAINFPFWKGVDASHLAIDPEGRIVLAGTATYSPARLCDTDFAFVRLLPSGKIDEGFSDDGRHTVGFDLGPVIADTCHYWADTLKAIAVLPDSSIVAVGSALYTSSNHQRQWAMAKLDSTGYLDLNFNGNGKLNDFVCPVCTDSDIADMTMQSDGKFLIAGTTTLSSTSDFFVMRRLSDGGLDNDFGIGGITYLPLEMEDGDGNDQAAAITLQNGRPLVVGNRELPANSADVDMGFARLQADHIFEHDFELKP